jgi:hypothetical protein
MDPSLYRFVIRQLATHEAAGDLRPGELTPEEIVDETVVRAYRANGGKPSSSAT